MGKATRNPPRDVMLSHAGKQIGYGWVFGLHEALDQSGALFGPLTVAAVLAFRGDYRFAFAALAIPAVINLSLLMLAHQIYPHPEDMETNVPNVQSRGLPRVFWLYLAGAVLVAAGFADFPLIAYHFTKASTVAPDAIPVFYAVAMGVSGAGSLAFGRLFDRFGFSVIIVLTIIASFFAPLVFLGGFWVALIGMAVWGLGMGVSRIYHSGGGRANGRARTPRLHVRVVYCRLRHFLVLGQRHDWLSLRHFVAHVDCFLDDFATSRRAVVFHRCKTNTYSPKSSTVTDYAIFNSYLAFIWVS